MGDNARRFWAGRLVWQLRVVRSGADASRAEIHFIAEIRVGRAGEALPLNDQRVKKCLGIAGERSRVMVAPWLGGEGSLPGSSFLGRNAGTSAAVPACLAARPGLVVCRHPPWPRESAAHRWRVAHGGARRDGQDSRSRSTAPCACPAAARAAEIAG